MAISKRNEISIGRECVTSLRSATRSYLRLIDFIESNEGNCVLASFEKVNKDINLLLAAVGAQIGRDLTLNEKQLSAVYGKKGDYLKRSQLSSIK